MTRLSVNINKIATLRNSRGGNMPSVEKAAREIQRFGAQGITIHPRPDERHIRYADVYNLKPLVHTEFNIEGNPIPKFIDMVLEIMPEQVTLVPDAENALTSNAGWDTVKNKGFLSEVIQEFKNAGIRTAIFVDPTLDMVKGAAATGVDRIELYTEAYAVGYAQGNEKAVEPYITCAKVGHELGLGINAGHDLSLDNLRFFKQNVPHLLEVSIGHALISEALYLGLETVVSRYIELLK